MLIHAEQRKQMYKLHTIGQYLEPSIFNFPPHQMQRTMPLTSEFVLKK